MWRVPEKVLELTGYYMPGVRSLARFGPLGGEGKKEKIDRCDCSGCVSWKNRWHYHGGGKGGEKWWVRDDERAAGGGSRFPLGTRQMGAGGKAIH